VQLPRISFIFYNSIFSSVFDSFIVFHADNLYPITGSIIPGIKNNQAVVHPHLQVLFDIPEHI